MSASPSPATPEDGTHLNARFLAALDHELRAPLHAIIVHAELLGSDTGGDAQRHAEYSGKILASARHLLQLVNSLVEVARADTGQLELARQPADLAGLLADAVHLVLPAAQRRGIRIALDLADAPARVALDAPRIMQALHGLLSGALDLADDRKTITLGLHPERDSRVRVELDGLRIGPGETGEFVIPPPGAWLGLALARSIVEAHGGRVGLGGPPGQRRTLHMVLPGVLAS